MSRRRDVSASGVGRGRARLSPPCLKGQLGFLLSKLRRARQHVEVPRRLGARRLGVSVFRNCAELGIQACRRRAMDSMVVHHGHLGATSALHGHVRSLCYDYYVHVVCTTIARVQSHTAAPPPERTPAAVQRRGGKGVWFPRCSPRHCEHWLACSSCRVVRARWGCRQGRMSSKLAIAS